MAPWLTTLDVLSTEPEPAGSQAPLSFSEEEMWYHALFEPDVPAYNEYDAFIIDGSLDSKALETALRTLAARHDAFRVTFGTRDGEPIARYGAEPQIAFQYDDLYSQSGDISELEASAHARGVIRERFDLEKGPLARACLARIGSERYLFLLAMHHLVKDVLSEGVLLSELSELYAAHRANRNSRLPPPAATPASWARLQCRLAAAGAFESQLEYWTSELAGAVPAEVLGDYPRPLVLSGVGATRYGEVGRETLTALRAIAHAEDASLFMLLISAYALLLQHYSGADDIPVAFPIAGRTEATAASVGCFINMLVFRAHFDEDRSFREYLRHSRETLRAAYANQDVPFAHVVSRLAPQRRADQSPIAAAVVTLRALWLPKLEFPDARVHRVQVDLGIARGFDLGMEFDVRDDGIGLELEYRTTLYRSKTAQRILRNFETLLRSIAAEPDASYRSLDVLSPTERETIAHWSAGPSRTLEDESLLEVFARRRAADGDATALVAGNRTMTYAALDAASTAAARALLAEGRAFDSDGDATPIAVVTDRSLESIVAMLAILKSGAAYVPLDPAYPAERVRFMIADSDATLTLVPRDRAGVGGDARIRIIEDLIERGAGLDAPLPTVRSSDAAYVMYTSGSTGIPNGVVIEHRSVVNYLDAFRTLCDLGGRDRVLQFSSPAFDISVEEIFGALTSGAALVMLPPASLNSISAVFEVCTRAGVTILDLPTAYFHEVVDAIVAGTVEMPASVRLTVVGGEALDRERVASFFAATRGRIRLLNTYGPTETTIVVTVNEVEHEVIHRVAGSVPIGRPIQNVRVELLDRYRRLVPIGVSGELYVGGAALARGYLDRPEVEHRRFVTDPSDGERWYATGDSVRLLANGVLQYRGRLDFQTKVRGFRLDPGEVEVALLSDARVRDAYVFIDSDERLVAAVVPASLGVRDAELRSALAERLPPFAVPSRIALVEKIPLTANGKRDRSALLRDLRETSSNAPAQQRVESDEGGEIRARLTSMWEELLGHPVAPDDDFFAAGGHSLLAARMFARAEAAFERKIPLNRFLARPTIAGLAELFEGPTEDALPLLTVYGADRKGRPFHYLHAGTGAGPFLGLLGAKLDVDRPLYAFAPHGTDGEPIPPTVEAMAADYIETIKRVQPNGPYTLAGHCLGAIIAIEMARQLRDRGDVVDQVIAIEAVSPNFVFARPLRLFDAIRRRLGLKEDVTRGLTARLKAYWRYVTFLADPERRQYGIDPFRRLWRRVIRRATTSTEASPAVDGQTAVERLSDRLLAVCDRYNPPQYDGRLVFIFAHEGPRDVLEIPIWRGTGRNVTILETPGAHITSVTTHVGDAAQLLSTLLR